VLMSLPSIQSTQAGLWLPCSLFGESFLHQSRAAMLGNAFEQPVGSSREPSLPGNE
jgi:hypothetical protein